MERCAWCHGETGELTRLNGVPYHWLCVKRRMTPVREKPAALKERQRRAARVLRNVRLAK
jgi:hypothetical protein